MSVKFHVVTLCRSVVRTFSVLWCAKMCQKFRWNCSDIECTELRTSSVTPRTTCGKISLFIKEKKLRRSCMQLWKKHMVNRRSLATPFLVGISSSCKGTEAKEWETSGRFYQDSGEYDRYDAFGWWFLIAMTDSTRRYFANTKKKIILSLFLFPAISIRVYAYAFMWNVCKGVPFALSGWFFYRWCNKLWATCCFFSFFDSRCSRLVTGLVSLLKKLILCSFIFW